MSVLSPDADMLIVGIGVAKCQKRTFVELRTKVIPKI